MISKFKRVVLAISAFAMAFSLFSCGGSDGNDSSTSGDSSEPVTTTEKEEITPPDISFPEDHYEGTRVAMTLPKFFQSGALFQANAPLTISGKGAPNALYKAEVRNNDVLWAGGYTTSDDKGNFSINIEKTPHASFDAYSVTVSGGGNSSQITNVLFGELWLCSGQSNMELPNKYQTGHEEFLEEVKTKNIRVLVTGTAEFTYEPNYQVACQWTSVSNTAAMMDLSALGLKYVSDLYDYLNEDAEVPVGFINAAYGGVAINSWFPRDAIEQDENMLNLLKRNGQYPTKAEWKPYPGWTSSQYNTKMASIEGIKVRGVLWYQGENEVASEYTTKSYAEYLKFYQKVYRERFGADPENFVVMSSLIYPHTYGSSGECFVGYLNDAFVQAAINEPTKFIAVPNNDLTPYYAGYEMPGPHPIHPINKYALGERMASVAVNSLYGGDNEQKTSAYLKEWKVEGNKIRLTFESVGTGLFVDTRYSSENQPIGLYVAGSDGIYLPAKCSVEGKDTLLVWCDEIANPEHVAYSVQSMEIRCNLWAGLYPVLPFFTNKTSQLNIQSRPWYDTSRESAWVTVPADNGSFNRPIWQPLDNSEVCHDDVNTRGEQSIHVNAIEKKQEFGCYLKAYNYNELDLGKFSSLSVDIFGVTNRLTAKIVVEQMNGKIVEVPLVQVEDYGDGWIRFEADLSSVQDAMQLSFVFKRSVGSNYLNIENIRLQK